MMLQKSKTVFHFNQFSQLDYSEQAGFLIDSMDVMYSLESVRHIKQRAIDRLLQYCGEAPILDIGCGLGHDVEVIASQRPQQSVFGIDISHRMLALAKSRSKQSNAHYWLGDVHALCFPDNYLGACHADRLLVGHTHPEAILREINRILLPNGVFCVSDVDAQSIIITPFTTLTQRILAALMRCFVNPMMGRQLPQLLSRCGFELKHTEVNISTIHDFNILEKIFDFNLLLKNMVDQQELSIQDAGHWQEEMRHASLQNHFYYTVNFTTVIAHKRDG